MTKRAEARRRDLTRLLSRGPLPHVLEPRRRRRTTRRRRERRKRMRWKERIPFQTLFSLLDPSLLHISGFYDKDKTLSKAQVRTEGNHLNTYSQVLKSKFNHSTMITIGRKKQFFPPSKMFHTTKNKPVTNVNSFRAQHGRFQRKHFSDTN